MNAIRVLEARSLSTETRVRLEDCRRICEEFAQVVRGAEPGEGPAAQRVIQVAMGRGRTEALSSMFACPAGIFIEFLVTAPWNLLGPDDPSDPRTVRGAGSALVSAAVEWSRRCGRGGRVALLAENPRTLRFYEARGFSRMRPSDRPLAIVPRGENGWSPSIVRLAQGLTGPEDEECPWLLLDPVRLRQPEVVPVRAAGGALFPG